MKFKLLIAIIVFAVSMFCGLVIVSNGILAGKYETLFPYTEKDVCEEGEKLILNQEQSTGSVTIDGNVYTDAAITQNTLFCVNEVSGDKREVTNETYAAVEKLRTRIGWYATIGIFLVVMFFILVFQSAILRKIDQIIGYKPPEEK